MSNAKTIVCPLCKGKDWTKKYPPVCPTCGGRKELTLIHTKKELKQIKYKKYQDAAVNGKRRFTKAEINAIKNYDNSASSLARKFGRSIKSIENARNRLRKAGEIGDKKEKD